MSGNDVAYFFLSLKCIITRGEGANLKIGSKPSQKWKMHEIKGNSIFLGECWTYKSGLKFFSGTPSAIFGHIKLSFLAKVPQKNWHFGYPNKNFKTTFISPTFPKNDGIAFGFKRLPLLDGF